MPVARLAGVEAGLRPGGGAACLPGLPPPPGHGGVGEAGAGQAGHSGPGRALHQLEPGREVGRLGRVCNAVTVVDALHRRVPYILR